MTVVLFPAFRAVKDASDAKLLLNPTSFCLREDDSELVSNGPGPLTYLPDTSAGGQYVDLDKRKYAAGM